MSKKCFFKNKLSIYLSLLLDVIRLEIVSDGIKRLLNVLIKNPISGYIWPDIWPDIWIWQPPKIRIRHFEIEKIRTPDPAGNSCSCTTLVEVFSEYETSPSKTKGS